MDTDRIWSQAEDVASLVVVVLRRSGKSVQARMKLIRSPTMELIQ